LKSTLSFQRRGHEESGIGIFGGAVFFLSILLVSPAWGMEVIKLGFTGPLSGGSAKYGKNSEAGLLMAMEEINGKGGIAVAGKILWSEPFPIRY
jgi:branched-chain amino acid transport system substrate-binding protein